MGEILYSCTLNIGKCYLRIFELKSNKTTTTTKNTTNNNHLKKIDQYINVQCKLKFFLMALHNKQETVPYIFNCSTPC